MSGYAGKESALVELLPKQSHSLNSSIDRITSDTLSFIILLKIKNLSLEKEFQLTG
jgi:hypothetical protein